MSGQRLLVGDESSLYAPRTKKDHAIIEIRALEYDGKDADNHVSVVQERGRFKNVWQTMMAIRNEHRLGKKEWNPAVKTAEDLALVKLDLKA